MFGLEELTNRYWRIVEFYERAEAEVPALQQELTSVTPLNNRDSTRKDFLLKQILPYIEDSENSRRTRIVYEKINIPVIGFFYNLAARTRKSMNSLKAAENQVVYRADFIDKIKVYLEEHRR